MPGTIWSLPILQENYLLQMQSIRVFVHDRGLTGGGKTTENFEFRLRASMLSLPRRNRTLAKPHPLPRQQSSCQRPSAAERKLRADAGD